MDNRPINKRVLILSTAGVLLVIFLVWLYSFLHTGRIIITTNDPNYTISLSRLSANPTDVNKPKSFTGRGRLEIDVHTGQYLAAVHSNSSAASRIINMSSRKTLSYEIDAKNPKGVEPVIFQNAQALVEDGGQLLFLDNNAHKIYDIDANNDLSALPVAQQFQRVRWANSSYGVGQDGSGHLYTISSGTAASLNVPFSYKGAPVNFDVASNRQLYVAYGPDIYRRAMDGNFTKIYTSKSSNPLLVAGTDGVAIADGAQDQVLTKKITLVTVSSSGKTSKKALGVGTLSWSPNGQYLFVGDTNGSANLFNSKLQPVATLPNLSPVNLAAWKNDNTVLYTSNDQLWTYNLSNQKAELLANMPLGAAITDLSVSSNNQYAYVITVNTSLLNGIAIRRVGLQGQAVPKTIYQLQSILPMSLGACNLSLINFTKPTVLVQSEPSQAQQCQQQAKNELQSRGFDLSSLQFSS